MATMYAVMLDTVYINLIVAVDIFIFIFIFIKRLSTVQELKVKAFSDACDYDVRSFGLTDVPIINETVVLTLDSTIKGAQLEVLLLCLNEQTHEQLAVSEVMYFRVSC